MSCNRSEIYTCSNDDNCDCLVEAVRGCAENCEISCCGNPLKKAEPKTADQGKEKHVPVVEKIEGGYRVKVGEVPHPMEEDHYIEFIELKTCDEVHRKYLKPGVAPEAIFMTEAQDVKAIEFCNKHGLWIK
ncbi:MAG: desulfoferrodoxin family protein [Candidatus Omnitrophica bacterium]|nr:desulfoferrodoxin family protein [Candidatus Omnitrophota bacterium]